jgi:cellulose synthase/poly-beta-1,6-N-acetylglucosamine synthase-like glycosyltransferase
MERRVEFNDNEVTVMETGGETIRCSMGIIAHNEEKNIGPLLQAIRDQHLYQVEITEIIVVASGCTDETIPIVQEVQQRDSRIKLLVQERREGKTSAINLFLQEAKEDICVQESADTLPHEDAVEHLVRMFADPTIGMTGAHKLPVDTPDHLAQVFTHLRLRMEHQLCMDIPRLGEMIAYRKVFDRIPPDVAMDEAFVEALVIERGLHVKYAPDAIVYNTGPTTVRDFVKQRRRNHAGHLYLKHKYDYAVSSIQTSRVIKVALKEVWGVVRLLGVLAALALLEGWSRLLGWIDFAIRKDRHMVWDMAYTQKADVRQEHAATQSQTDARSTATALLVEHE